MATARKSDGEKTTRTTTTQKKTRAPRKKKPEVIDESMDIFAESAASAAAKADQEAAIMSGKPVVSTPAPVKAEVPAPATSAVKEPVASKPASAPKPKETTASDAKTEETEDYVTANFRVPRWVRDRLKMAAALRKTTSVDLLIQWVGKMPDFEALANDIEF